MPDGTLAYDTVPVVSTTIAISAGLCHRPLSNTGPEFGNVILRPACVDSSHGCDRERHPKREYFDSEKGWDLR
jgi:hypothetical protein